MASSGCVPFRVNVPFALQVYFFALFHPNQSKFLHHENLPLLEGCVTSLFVKSNLFFYTSHDQAASGGIIRGAGKQRVGAICYFLGFYGIGFPIGIPLMFVAKQGIKGEI